MKRKNRKEHLDLLLKLINKINSEPQEDPIILLVFGYFVQQFDNFYH